MKRLKKSELDFLTQHAQKLLPKLRREFSTNIVGIHYGKKVRNNTEKRINAIVFHVKQKLSHPIKGIPKSIFIKMPDGSLREVPTDVIQTGPSRLLSIMMGDKAKTRTTPSSDYGTAGLFMKKGATYYVCSNMHVLAPQFISRGRIEIPASSQRLDIRMLNAEESAFAFLEKASFQSIDLAMAVIERPSLIQNRIRSIGNISGEANIQALRRGDRIISFGATSGSMQGDIREINVARVIEYDGKTTHISNLIVINCDPNFGDSGSPVLLERNRAVIGILVSMDDDKTGYVINIDAIKSFTKAQLVINQNV